MEEMTIVQNSNWAAFDEELQSTLQTMLDGHTEVKVFHNFHIVKDTHEYTIYSRWYGLKTRADFEVPANENLPIPALAMMCMGAILDNFLGQIESGLLKVQKVEGKSQITIGLSL